MTRPLDPARPIARRARLRRRAALLALALLAPLAHAQDGVDDPPPALVSIGVAGGFPSYQTASLRVGLQAGAVGADLRAGYGPGAGASFGAALRGYPPLPGLPVPVWVGGGVMATAGSAVPFAALGAHVPVAPRVRLDLEGGVAWTRLGTETRLVPHLQAGVSYAFATELPRAPAADRAEPRAAGRSADRCEPGPPRPEELGSAVRDAERRFVADARATYGSLYRSLRYTLRITGERVDGERATVDLAYDGSVVEIATGRTVEADGTAQADFGWTGCGWTLRDLRY
jgi:hypothetical protein